MPRSPLFIVSLLGALSVISPFAIDMYLPAYHQIARDFATPSATIALTLSSYFIGLAAGQLFYGPLLDRFGRKKPLYGGLGVFILAAIGCSFAPTIEVLIALRFLQAVGGCVAGIASLAMVHDFFPIEQSAKIISRLFLFIAISPLLAPSTGGMITLAIGWRAVFFLLAAIVAAILALVHFCLPEGHKPDPTISLKPGPILREYRTILSHPTFITYALAGAFSFAGLFTYVAGSPIIFMDGFHLSAQVYSGIFALLATGFIGASQINVVLLRRFTSEQLFLATLIVQVIAGGLFLLGTVMGWWGLIATLMLFYVFLSCGGMAYPNAAALALAPFTKNAGSASAMLGFLQLTIGAVISTGIGFVPTRTSMPIIVLLAVTSTIALIVLLIGRRRAHARSALE